MSHDYSQRHHVEAADSKDESSQQSSDSDTDEVTIYSIIVFEHCIRVAYMFIVLACQFFTLYRNVIDPRSCVRQHG